VGPTLGAASTLAAQGSHLEQVALLMLVFGLGAGTPLVVLGTTSREVAARLRGSMASAGKQAVSIRSRRPRCPVYDAGQRLN